MASAVAWNDQNIALASRLWGEGKSAGYIAKLIPCANANIVIGKMHRLKVKSGNPKGFGAGRTPAPSVDAAPLCAPARQPRATAAPPLPAAPPAVRRRCPPLSQPCPAFILELFPDKPKVAPPPANSIALRDAKTEAARAQFSELEVAAVAAPEVNRGVLYLKMLERGQCKWILNSGADIDELLCCGGATYPGESYCGIHSKRGTASAVAHSKRTAKMGVRLLPSRLMASSL